MKRTPTVAATAHWQLAVVAGVLIFLILPWAFATDLYFSDLIVRSPNGRFRLEARSPDNAPGQDRTPFQKNFTYTLYEGDTDKVIWVRKQADSSPVTAFVNNGGWVTVWTAAEHVIGIAPGGTTALDIDILGCIPETERKDYVLWSTAGFMWAANSHWYFLDFEEKPLFCIRTWWGRRIVVDLQAGETLGVEAGSELEKALFNSEKELVLRTLEQGANLGEALEDAGPDATVNVWSAITAAHMAGRMRIREAVPKLRQLEASKYIGSSGGGFVFSLHGLKKGEIDPTEWSDFNLRKVTQLSLRRMGERPACHPATEFRHYAKRYEDMKPFEPLAHAEPREQRAGSVKENMKPLEALKEIGPPDYVGCGPGPWPQNWYWDYDMDAEEPYTLRVTWNAETPTVQSTQRIMPPLWQVGDTRDGEILY